MTGPTTPAAAPAAGRPDPALSTNVTQRAVGKTWTPIVPFSLATSLYHLQKYYRVHKRAHLDPDWAREHLPWHYDHHMGPDQDQNWGVTRPWFDKVMGTRVVYLGTEKEEKDRARRLARAKKVE